MIQKYWIIIMLFVLSLTGCARLDAIDYTPKLSPEAFLQQQPSVHIAMGSLDFMLCQPSSSVFVFLVAFFTIFTGYKILSRADGQWSRQWWGVGLLLTGVGALLAGVSYQAMGYEIKCNGREFCTFTSWWEIFYMLLSALGMAAFVIAAAYSNAQGLARKTIIYCAALGAISYSAMLLWGAFTANQLLVSFEFMAVFSTMVVLFLIALHGSGFAKNKDAMNLTSLKAWLIFVAVFLGYILYLTLQISAALWKTGVWFTENDVLHLGMIYWVFYVGRNVANVVQDAGNVGKPDLAS